MHSPVLEKKPNMYWEAFLEPYPKVDLCMRTKIVKRPNLDLKGMPHIVLIIMVHKTFKGLDASLQDQAVTVATKGREITFVAPRSGCLVYTTTIGPKVGPPIRVQHD